MNVVHDATTLTQASQSRVKSYHNLAADSDDNVDESGLDSDSVLAFLTQPVTGLVTGDTSTCQSRRRRNSAVAVAAAGARLGAQLEVPHTARGPSGPTSSIPVASATVTGRQLHWQAASTSTAGSTSAPTRTALPVASRVSESDSPESPSCHASASGIGTQTSLSGVGVQVPTSSSYCQWQIAR